MLDFLRFLVVKSFWFGKISNIVGAYLMMDMAHINGLIVDSIMVSSFDICDVVKPTTHKVSWCYKFSVHFTLSIKNMSILDETFFGSILMLYI